MSENICLFPRCRDIIIMPKNVCTCACYHALLCCEAMTIMNLIYFSFVLGGTWLYYSVNTHACCHCTILWTHAFWKSSVSSFKKDGCIMVAKTCLLPWCLVVKQWLLEVYAWFVLLSSFPLHSCPKFNWDFYFLESKHANGYSNVLLLIQRLQFWRKLSPPLAHRKELKP